MATGDRTKAPVPNVGTNQRYDKVDHELVASTFEDVAGATHGSLISAPIAVAGLPTGELWVGSITTNPSSGTDGLVQVDTTFAAGLDADGGLIVVAEGTALQAAIPAGGSDHQVYLYNTPVEENSQIRRFMPASGPFTEFPQAQNVQVRLQAALHIRPFGAGSEVASDVAGGKTRPLLYLGLARNTGGVITFTPVVNRLETVTPPSTLPASSTGNTSASAFGTTYSTGDQATIRGLVNSCLHATARDRWLGSNNYVPSAANNYGAYTETAEGLDVASRKHLDFVTIGEDASTAYGTFNRDDYASDDLLLAAALAALPSTGGTIYIKPGFTLDNFAADVTVPASTRVKFQSDVHRSLSRVTFDMGDYNFVCATGGTNGALEFEDCTFLTTSATTNGNIVELHDDFAFKMKGCYLAVLTANTAAPVAMITANAATVDLHSITIEDCVVSYSCAHSNSLTGRYFLDLGAVFAANLLIKDCAISCQGDFATAYGGRMVNVNNMGRNVKVLNCTFSTIGETTSVGGIQITALFLQAVTTTELNRDSRVVQGCSFRGRTSLSLTRNMYGIEFVNMRYMRVLGCEFEQGDAAIQFLTTGGFSGRSDVLVSDCTIRDCANSVSMSLDGGTTLEGIKVEGCTIETGWFSISDTSSPIKDILVAGNTFIDVTFRVYGSTLTNALILGNTFTVRSGVTDIPAPLVGFTGSLLYGVVFKGNTVQGYNTLTGADFIFGLQVQGASVRGLDVSGNKFHDIQSDITWTNAADSSTNHHIISLRCNAFAGSTKVDNNTFTHIRMSVIQGGAGDPNPPVLIHMTNQARDGAGVSLGVVSLSNNMCDDVYTTPVYLEDVGAQVLKIDNNTWHSLFNAGFLGLSEITVVTLLGYPVNFLSFCGNVLVRDGAMLATDFFSHQGGGGLAPVEILKMCDNFIDLAADTTAAGLTTTGAIAKLLAIGNVCAFPTYIHGVTITTGVPSVAAPGTYGDNINLERVA